jgi:hypothetical protein
MEQRMSPNLDQIPSPDVSELDGDRTLFLGLKIDAPKYFVAIPL